MSNHTNNPIDRVSACEELEDGDVYRLCEANGTAGFWVGSYDDLAQIDGEEYGLSRAIRLNHGEDEDAHSEVLGYAAR